MPMQVALLRGINVGGNNRLPMKTLTEIVASLGHNRVKTHLQSGNAVFSSEERDEEALTSEVEQAVERACGFRPEVMLRTRSEIERVVEANPFSGQEFNPSRLITVFLRSQSSGEAIARLESNRFPDINFFVVGREMYVMYGDGMGQSKFGPAYYERRLGTLGTARNWNTVTKVLALLQE